jgi:glycosyltransferase involved in cell wall biosynthesis
MNNMENLLYIIFTYNRPKILEKMIDTLFSNGTTHPKEVVIIDDGSNTPKLKLQLLALSLDLTKQGIPCHFFSFNQNQGLGYQWELAFNYIKSRNFQYVFLLEQDYIFRQGGIDEAIEVLKKNPESLALSGYSNPDFYKLDKTEQMFPDIMKEQFGIDLVPRELMHKPFLVDTKFGNIQVQLTSNSCGTYLMNWYRVKQLLGKFPEMQQTCLNRAFNIPFPERRRYAGDGPLTCGFTHYFYMDVLERIKSGENIDLSKVGAWLDICDFSISDHKNGGQDSLNGHIVPEMASFVSSPKWNDEFLIKNPRH